jgi:hypothetical protein
VKRADEALRATIAVAVGQWHATVAASIVESSHALLGPYDDDGFVEDLVFGPIADTGDLLESAGHLPDMRPNALALEFVEPFIEVTSRTNALSIRDTQR